VNTELIIAQLRQAVKLALLVIGNKKQIFSPTDCHRDIYNKLTISTYRATDMQYN